MAGVTNSQLSEQIGKLISDSEHAKDSRKEIRSKLDRQEQLFSETVRTLAEVQFALKVTTDVAVQARDKADETAKELIEIVRPAIKASELFQLDATPIIDLIKGVRLALWVLSSILASGGVFTVSAIAFFQDSIRETIRAWLGIG